MLHKHIVVLTRSSPTPTLPRLTNAEMLRDEMDTHRSQ